MEPPYKLGEQVKLDMSTLDPLDPAHENMRPFLFKRLEVVGFNFPHIMVEVPFTGEWAYVLPDILKRVKEVPKEEPCRELTGDSSDYYIVHVGDPTSPDVEPYDAECNDLIEALGLNFAEGNVFKALWRRAAARHGNGKPGTDDLYDAEKIHFFAKRILRQAKEKN